MTSDLMEQALLRLCTQLQFRQVDNLFVVGDHPNHQASKFV
jgi:hypothetical protein